MNQDDDKIIQQTAENRLTPLVIPLLLGIKSRSPLSDWKINMMPERGASRLIGVIDKFFSQNELRGSFFHKANAYDNELPLSPTFLNWSSPG